MSCLAAVIAETDFDALRAYRATNPDHCPRCAGNDHNLTPLRIRRPASGEPPKCCANDPRSPQERA
ncbi:MAG: hypothetical protein ISN29_03965 [Gammaproteobacteria bacterium AqS3]|nr:hypothetical protein [Gammaproteobacteria bacterium AqS3]